MIPNFNRNNLKQRRRKIADKKVISYFGKIWNTQFDQGSPVNPVSEFKGGGLSVTHGQTNKHMHRKSYVLYGIAEHLNLLQNLNVFNLSL